MEDSPIMGLLTEHESAKSENLETQGKKRSDILSEVTVKKAIWKRATYLRSKSEQITVAGVRRLLEEDLQLDKYSLDIFKKLISKQLDEVLNSPEIPDSATSVKKKTSANSQGKAPSKISSKGSTDSPDSGSDDIENEVKPERKSAIQGNRQALEGLKKRKRPKETQRSRKKQNKLAEETSEEKNGEDLSEDQNSQSSTEKPVKYLNGKENDEIVSKDSGETEVKQAKEEEEERPEEHLIKEDVKAVSSEDGGKMEDSPIMCLLTEHESAKSENLETQGKKKSDILSEVTVKKAIWKRATYLRSKSEQITVAGVRRLLEEDLQLDKYSLDIFKKLISKQLDEVLNSPEIPDSATSVKKKTSVNSQGKAPSKIGSKGSTDSPDSGSDDIENGVKPERKSAIQGKCQVLEGLKKRKRPKETQRSRKKQNKLAEETSEEKNGEDLSEDQKSQSSTEKPVKKEVVAPAYGRKVEDLKSIIRSCGMSVAPSVYVKAKQVPADKREAFLIKELQEILSREGLSATPTEKEIKEVKRRKERAKELEGIDTSNIVLSSRRRSTSNFVAPPKPKVPVESDEDDSEDSEDTENDDGDDEDEDDSQSEDAQEDDNDSD